MNQVHKQKLSTEKKWLCLFLIIFYQRPHPSCDGICHLHRQWGLCSTQKRRFKQPLPSNLYWWVCICQLRCRSADSTTQIFEFKWPPNHRNIGEHSRNAHILQARISSCKYHQNFKLKSCATVIHSILSRRKLSSQNHKYQLSIDLIFK